MEGGRWRRGSVPACLPPEWKVVSSPAGPVRTFRPSRSTVTVSATSSTSSQWSTSRTRRLVGGGDSADHLRRWIEVQRPVLIPASRGRYSHGLTKGGENQRTAEPERAQSSPGANCWPDRHIGNVPLESGHGCPLCPPVGDIPPGHRSRPSASDTYQHGLPLCKPKARPRTAHQRAPRRTAWRRDGRGTSQDGRWVRLFTSVPGRLKRLPEFTPDQ